MVVYNEECNIRIRIEGLRKMSRHAIDTLIQIVRSPHRQGHQIRSRSACLDVKRPSSCTQNFHAHVHAMPDAGKRQGPSG
jgi:hypothetical protein